MSTRFHLRFEGGDRDGELVPVPRSGLLVGRRPTNDLRLEAPSVSGRHALLRPEGDQLRVEDMGSTNGTKVDGQKIELASLAHGQRVVFGDVAFEVVDAQAVPSLKETAREPMPPEVRRASESVGFELEDEIELGGGSDAVGSTLAAAPRPEDATVPARAVPAARRAPAGDASGSAPVAVRSELPIADELEGETLARFDESLLERTRGSNRSTWIVSALLLVGAGVAGWMLLGRGGGEAGERAAAAPLARQGNLLAGGDLEGEALGVLESLEGSIELFAEPYAAASGRVGLGGEFLPGDRLRARTAAVSLRSGRPWSAVAELRASEGLPVALGLELFASDGSRSMEVWSDTSIADGEWRTVEVTALARSGFDRARLWLDAGPFESEEELTAEIAVDDLGIVPAEEPSAPSIEEGAFELALWSPDRRGATQFHAFVPLFSLRTADPRTPAVPAGRLALAAADPHPRLTLEGGDERLWIELHPRLEDGAPRALATQGSEGFRRRSGEFEAEQVAALVIGSGASQTRLSFENPASLRTFAGDGLQRVRIDLVAGSWLEVQTDFSRELALAIELASSARSAERDGRLGDALSLWSELVASYPFEPQYLAEAEARRAALLASGLEQLRSLEEQVGRARFFTLSGIYEQCERAAVELLERYSPRATDGPSNEVSSRAQDLLASIRSQQAALGGRDLESERRARILGWVERNGAERLAQRLRVDGRE